MPAAAPARAAAPAAAAPAAAPAAAAPLSVPPAKHEEPPATGFDPFAVRGHACRCACLTDRLLSPHSERLVGLHRVRNREPSNIVHERVDYCTVGFDVIQAFY